MPETRPSVGIDATPLRSAHRVRGIGRYVDGVLSAIGTTEPAWVARDIGVLLAQGQPAPFEAASTWRTARSPWRPQDLDPVVAVVAVRLAFRRHRPRLWHHTDPTIPSSPLRAARTLVTVYDLIPLQVPRVMAAIRPHRRAAYRRYLDLVRSSRGVIAISDTTGRVVADLLGIDPDRIHVVPPSIVMHAGPDVVEGDDRAGADRHLVFVGVPDPHKRPELAIDALAELRRRGADARLTMVGLHPPAIRRSLIERVRTAGVEGRVRFVDRIDDDSLAGLYRGSITLALSSVEGFGLPPVEAVLAGGRVVATPIDAYRETLTGNATFAASADAAAVADAVERACDQPRHPDAVAMLSDRYSPLTVSLALRRAYDALGAS